MKNLAIFVLFIFTLPFLAAVGHDFYIYHQTGMTEFRFIGVGWILTNYAPEYYSQILTLVDGNEKMLAIYGAVLEQKAVIAGLIIMAIAYVPIILIAFFVKASKNQNGSSKFKVRKNAKNAPITVNEVLGREVEEIKYKRK